MRKIGYAFLLCVILFTTSCSIPAKKPETGIWFCEELKISIDFSLAQNTSDSAILHNDDGSCEPLGCHFDFGNGIYFFQRVDDVEIDYLRGTFKWKNDEFIVTSINDENTYVFVENKETDSLY